METPALLPLPLHPRRAQQLFQEILLTDAQSTPELSCQALPQRLHQLQRLNLSGIHEAKRGTTFQRIRTAADAVLQIETETVTLRLAKDGSTLQIALEDDYRVAVSIPLLDIQAIILHTTPVHSFSFQLDSCGDGCDNNIGNTTVNENASDFSDIFISTSDEILNRWIVTLTCGINAFQQQLQQTRTQSPDFKAAQLVWQAARLRIFELAEIMPLPAAIDHVSRSIPEQDFQSAALRSYLYLLRCDL